jgi:pimeloyl-ACP methyl ester carboxylesterase
MLRLEVIGDPMLNMSFRHSDKKIARIFAPQQAKPEVRYLELENMRLRYMQLVVDESVPLVVFIHGAPGSLGDYIDFFKDERLYNNVNLLSIDRPGYGYSAFGRSETSLQKQSVALEQIIRLCCKDNRIILVGHSYGGPIALQLAADNPQMFSNIILLAPAIDPGHEKEIKIASLGVSVWSRWAVPPALRVAADEKFTHVSELKKLEPELSDIHTPICHIHGTNDSLVPYENIYFSGKKFNADLLELITLQGVDHFLPWSHHDLVVDKILELTDVEVH